MRVPIFQLDAFATRRFEGNPAAVMIELIKAMEPAEVHVVSGQANATKAELQVAGKESDGATMKGTATLLMEDGAWKIEKVDTSSSMGK